LLQYTISKPGQAPQHLDLHALPVGGTFAHKLPGPDLYAELVKLGVPNIIPQMGWQDLAIAYAKWRNDPSAAAEGGVTGSKMLGAGS
jgi:hypothetical protein